MPPVTRLPPRRPARLAAIAASVAVTISGAVATALYLGGTHTGPPAPLSASVAGGQNVPGYAVVSFSWKASPDATGYRVWVDGTPDPLIGAYTATTLPVSCGVKHRINVQPFNNKGFAALVPPLYVTSPCKTATT